ncbi:hypothetical protein [Chitinophaga pinensis]|uniref:Uncharacterized protein n=1 Tax=Chitinophaga pinensis TaxID=79329 RepID=A0A5C6LPG6_9BACT|nr:hypothetical protein [Chitinophaga pinensis]TWV97946.1 hypothetical protein FEF09_21215 [Chitinophaga pinensis]
MITQRITGCARTDQPCLAEVGDVTRFGSDFDRYTATVLLEYFIRLQAIHGLNNPLNGFFDYADGAFEMMEAFSAFSRIPIKDAAQLSERLNITAV